jgi:hypothetical protein
MGFITDVNAHHPGTELLAGAWNIPLISIFIKPVGLALAVTYFMKLFFSFFVKFIQ